MKIENKTCTISEISENYKDDNENGVTAYNGLLDVRPAFQREFVYKDKQRAAVIDSIKKGFPLNTMYWSKKHDNTYEIIDGKQRTISICQYVKGIFSYKDRYFHNLTNEEQEQILNYKLQIYVCEGTDKEKLEWFETINIAGEKLTKQELRNAVYSGPWLTEAKKYFSKRNCPAYEIAKDYIKGSTIRQDFLEQAIEWIADYDKEKYEGKIEQYMALHQHDDNALELWHYFENVIDWVKRTFTNKRTNLFKGVPWGKLYNQYKNKNLVPNDIEQEIKKLIDDDEVENKRGIFQYIFTRDEKHLNLRSFTKSQKQKAYEKQNGKCKHCKKEFEFAQMDADHIIPWSHGGKTNENNLQMLCKKCNQIKSNK